ncbi:MAG: SPOR domain-containing protein [Nitrospinae bacterium]|nr:SPOR domain-containing protein [Nitrospinota bacterium]
MMASVAGLHFSGIIGEFQENYFSPEKMRAVKPDSIRNKVKEPIPSKPVYTFFETLNDLSMTQYVDLQGRLMPGPLASGKAILSSEKIASTSLTPSVEKNAKLEPAVKTESKQELKSAANVRPRYAVQVSSFRDEGRAGALKSRLQKNGFDAFLTQTEIANNDGTWHRVFLGRYADEQKAQEAASLARDKYKLDAVVVRNTN